MKKSLYIFAILLIIAIASAGCKKKEEPKPAGEMPPHGMMGPKQEPVIVVPETVKGKWKSVKIAVLDKSTGAKKELDIPIGSQAAIPGSNLVVAVDTFFPDFVMDGATRTSRSNDPKNPAAHVRILEAGKEVYKNWLFGMLQSPHAFQHPKYDVSLAGYTPAGK